MIDDTQTIRERAIISLDCETTGLSAAKGDRIVEVALVKQYPDGQIEEWSTLVNPEVEMQIGNIKIHGITNQMVSKAPTFETIWPRLQELMQDAIFVAHNARFDIGFLQAEVERLGQPFPTLDVLDTLHISRRLFGFPRNNLSIVAQRFHLIVHNAHRALPDARNALYIFWAMLADIEEREGQPLTSAALRQLCVDHEKQGPFRKAVIETIVHCYRNKRRLSIDYISRHPDKPIRSERTIEITKWDSPYVEANCLLRGEPRRFHLKQIQRADPLDEYFGSISPLKEDLSSRNTDPDT